MVTPRLLHVVGGFTIDAVIRPDGSWATEQLGGNALWAALGMRALADAAPAAHSVIGADYPERALDLIASRGVDVAGVRRDRLSRNARVTFAYRPDGSRSQPAPAEAVAALPEDVRPAFADTTRDPSVTLRSLPGGDELRHVDGASGGAWHLGLLPGTRFADIARTLRRAGAGYLQADCPARSELAMQGDDVLRAHLSRLDVFLPSTSDTDVFAPGVSHRELIARFHGYGAPVVVMKRGGAGAIVSIASTGEQWSVPAFPVRGHVDATGAGDVFCGVFAHFVAAGRSVLDAAVEASARASYATEVASPLELAPPDAADLAARVDQVRNGVTSL